MNMDIKFILLIYMLMKMIILGKPLHFIPMKVYNSVE